MKVRVDVDEVSVEVEADVVVEVEADVEVEAHVEVEVDVQVVAGVEGNANVRVAVVVVILLDVAKGGVEMVASLADCWSWAAWQLAERIARCTSTSLTANYGKSTSCSQPAAITHCPFA